MVYVQIDLCQSNGTYRKELFVVFLLLYDNHTFYNIAKEVI